MLTGESHFGRLAEITLRSPIDFAEAVAQIVHLASIEVSIDWQNIISARRRQKWTRSDVVYALFVSTHSCACSNA